MTSRPLSGSLASRVILIAGMVLLAGHEARAVTLEAVLESSTVVPPSRVEFVEERHNPLLREPLVLTGYLEYLGEGRLRKVVQTPFAESFLVDGETLEVSRDGQERRISLQQGRSVKVMLDGIEALLAGDAEQVEALFDYTVAGEADDWNVKLVPRSRRVLDRLRGVVVTGDRDSITTIRFDLEEGEWYRLRIGGPDTDERDDE